MKVKLLRKVRREFKIEYWPNGLPKHLIKTQISYRVIYSRSLLVQFSDPCVTLTAGDKIMYPFPAHRQEGEQSLSSAILEAKQKLISILRDRYPILGGYQRGFTKQQIWP